jgi:hypothetical protein
MNNGLERVWEGSVSGLIQGNYSGICLESQEIHEKLQTRPPGRG